MILRKTVLLLLCIISLTAIVSCDIKENEIPAEQYQIVYPVNADSRIIAAAEKIKTEIEARYGKSLRITADYYSSEYDYEILVGDTDRDASKINPAELGNDGWTVRREGRAIVINGSTLDAIDAAADYFIAAHSFEEDKVYLKTADSFTKKYDNPDYSKGISLRVGSYNIRHGELVDYDMSRLAADILACDLDIVGLQEVDKNTRRTGNKDLLRELAAACGYEYYAFFAAMDFNGGEYGVGIISKYPINSTDSKMLSVIPDTEPRVVAHAVIEVNGVKVDFYNAHLSFESNEIRATQLAEVREFMGESRTAVLAGDFNVVKTDEIDIAFPDHRRANNDNLPTFPVGREVIDEIVGTMYWSIKSCEVYDVGGNSDHGLLWATFAYDGGKNNR